MEHWAFVSDVIIVNTKEAKIELGDGVISAIIQGGCTIIAAGIAVLAARAGLNAWREEAPGRRRLELAEQCLGAAYGVHEQIISFSSDITHFMLDEAKLNVSMSAEERKHRKQTLDDAKTNIRQGLNVLRATTRISGVYFEDDLGEAYWSMYMYFLHWDGILNKFYGLCDQTFERSADKQALYLNITPEFGSKGHKYGTEQCTAPIKLYEKALKPHLGNLAFRTRKPRFAARSQSTNKAD